ncbi:MAG: hypothetical protein Q4F67_04460, partial [Propionibacteriaceae bacterium]|nr:hypothetical protein [Propionibacteriaceae bacterium]
MGAVLDDHVGLRDTAGDGVVGHRAGFGHVFVRTLAAGHDEQPGPARGALVAIVLDAGVHPAGEQGAYGPSVLEPGAEHDHVGGRDAAGDPRIGPGIADEAGELEPEIGECQDRRQRYRREWRVRVEEDNEAGCHDRCDAETGGVV